ncbi:MAG: InlB B-repeat-containing protein, partial [Clostridia bacterium]|nr:InlB B-repeat-containing protein [Clostridia bacterium]
MKRIIAVILSLMMICTIIPAAGITVSAAYENTHTNTGNQIEDLIAVAMTQRGYCEGNSSSQLGGTVAGSGNYTKYGQWYGINPGAWCAMFVSWCANQAGIPSSVIPKHASCDVGMNWFKNNGKWNYSKYFGGSYTPKRGDIIYFGDNANNLNDSTHVGIVTGVDSSKVYTVEGNKSNKCKEVSYSLSSSYIFGYGTPSYTSTGGGSTSAYSTGTYIITAANLNMRSTASTSGTIVAVLTSGTYVEVTAVSGKWGFITYGTKTGWISLAYATPVDHIRYSISENGLDFLKAREGYQKYAYWDVSQWSIGYGTACGENEYPNGITEPEAATLLKAALVKYEVYLNNFLFDNNIDVNQNQYDALASFTYNLGNYWTKSFTLKTYLINGVQNYTDAQITAAFQEICHAGGEFNQGLYNRRTLEAQLFLTPVDGEGEEIYTITFDPNGGTITSGNSSYRISYGEYYTDVIGTAPTASRSGYTFGGWYCEKYDYTLVINEHEYFAVKEDCTFKAVWTENTTPSTTYTVSYNANGGTGAPSSQTKNAGTALTLRTTPPTRSGYNFAGWAESSTGAAAYPAGGSYIKDQNITLYAVWSADPLASNLQYTITASTLNIRPYADSHNTIGTTDNRPIGSVTNGAIVNIQTTYDNADGSKWGYGTNNQNSVVGWMCLTTSSGTSYATRVYGVFYNLANGGSGSFGSHLKNHGTNITLSSAVPTRSGGYTFLGWSPIQSATAPAYLPGATFVENQYCTLYDIWQAPAAATYTVSYNANGGAGAPASQTKTQNVTLKLSSTVPTRAGYTFAGWSTSSNGSVEYSPGANYTANAPVTLFAVWQAVTYTVSYNANGGSGAPADQIKTHGVHLTLSSSVPTRSGYTFLGWSTSSSAAATFMPGDIFAIDADTTLFAVWQENAVTKFTLTFDPNGGALTSGQQTYQIANGEYYCDVIGTAPTAARNGYVFDGWYCEKFDYRLSLDPAEYFAANENCTFKAIWIESAPPSSDIAIEKLSGYDVKLTGLDPASAYVIRYATGEYSNASAVKKGLNAGFVQVSGVAEATVSLPTHGLHTVCAAVGSEQKFIGTVTIDESDMKKEVEIYIDDLNLRVLNLYGATRVNLLDQYGNVLMKINPTSFTTDGLKTWADVVLPDGGVYTLRVMFGSEYIEAVFTATVPAANVSTNGRIFTLSSYGVNNVSYIRFAKGIITT